MIRFVCVLVFVCVQTNTQSTAELRQRPPFAGQTSGGPLGQLIPPGDPLPSENGANFGPEGLAAVELGNRNKETPLEYKPEKPFFAGSGSSGGPLPQIIPPGPPWPASAEGYNNSELLGNRIQETSDIKPGNSTSLENNPNRPSFAGLGFIGGPLPQIIPPGMAWPANSGGYNQSNLIGNRINENSTENSSNPETNPDRPFFAGNGMIGGPLPQLVPSGPPWPANPEGYNESDILGNRIQEGLSGNSSNSENNPNRPSFAGTGLIGGPLPQIIPSGPTLPDSMQTSTVEDRFDEDIPEKSFTSERNPDLGNKVAAPTPYHQLFNRKKIEALLALFIPTS